MKRKVEHFGLRGATPEQIKDKIKELTEKGYRVEHRTHSTTSGDKLPYNGLLIATPV